MAMNNILGLFAQSPLKPLQKHSEKVTEACNTLIPFIDAVFADDWDKAEQVRQQIVEIEREADALKREIRLKLPRGLFLPIDRTDLLELVTQQDKLANYAKDIAGRMVSRQFTIPSELHENFRKFVCRSIDAAIQSNKVVDEMDSLLETGFKGRELTLVNNMIDELDHIEDETDQMQIILRRELRQIEGRFNPIDVISLYKIFEWVGVLADQAQRVGSRIELMLARS